MDDIVKQAMAKWPNVPHCYGWLALDARGGWRMRDEAAQRADAAGDKLTNPALVGFINRNYGHDERGNWYFQNGPQRVYVNLEATPFIARTDPQQGLVLQTGQALAQIEHVYLSDAGAVLFQAGEIVAQLDDRDVAQVLGKLQLDGQAASDEAVMAWLENGAGKLALPWNGKAYDVERIGSSDLPQRFGFNQLPTP
ncbi:DUF2946 family protein [Massilia sp. YIM B02443]|uniref:DUF2946 family protein n=1 Tax=Massilia sp. YIM B02443 TaxID=3050127 RepID=UPI0025B6F520|nr:DUF2946 family protein [Massilia sp. YIM B02443]MDN4037223.1 DUF2946 family protein [Massilia sp. YIM B02443]